MGRASMVLRVEGADLPPKRGPGPQLGTVELVLRAYTEGK